MKIFCQKLLTSIFSGSSPGVRHEQALTHRANTSNSFENENGILTGNGIISSTYQNGSQKRI